MNTSLNRRAFMMSVDPDKKQECLDYVSKVSSDLTNQMKKNGIHQYSLFLDQDSCLLFGFLEYRSERGLETFTSSEECKQWWKETSQFIISNEDNSPISTDLQEVFRLTNVQPK